jgi:hypothetical protein
MLRWDADSRLGRLIIIRNKPGDELVYLSLDNLVLTWDRPKGTEHKA